ncbi:hypothetical protein KUTeg_019514 [Tegillarca granosa]|uniref:Uncharacterized protein n=1 Tax=Tegillarca granosa TaxID=220873 RepID=A0ABQ9EIQ9_TEGGR|nr:hypothetical protein KUTeg_019514 [Tegillarca granosa]
MSKLIPKTKFFNLSNSHVFCKERYFVQFYLFTINYMTIAEEFSLNSVYIPLFTQSKRKHEPSLDQVSLYNRIDVNIVVISFVEILFFLILKRQILLDVIIIIYRYIVHRIK